MKHLTIVKFIPEISKKIEKSFLEQIKEIFNGALEIDGVHYVNIHQNCTDRDNRGDILIEMDMDKTALEEWDHCDAHLLWKREYDRFIDSKMVIDIEA